MLHLANTLYVPGAHANLFSLQKVRTAGYRIVQDTWLPTVGYNEAFIMNSRGKTVGSIMEDESGRGTVDCKILMPPHTTVRDYEGGRSSSIAIPIPDVLVNLPTDRGSLNSSDTSDIMLGLGIERESPVCSIFDDADDDLSGGENDITSESESMVFFVKPTRY